MKTTIKTNQSESMLTIKEDFGIILEENFTAICKAIANRGIALNELKSLFDNNECVFEKIMGIIRHSRDEYQATNNLCVQLGISKSAAKYILALPLSTLGLLSAKFLNQKLNEHYWLVASLNPELEIDFNELQ